MGGIMERFHLAEVQQTLRVGIFMFLEPNQPVQQQLERQLIQERILQQPMLMRFIAHILYIMCHLHIAVLLVTVALGLISLAQMGINMFEELSQMAPGQFQFKMVYYTKEEINEHRSN